MRTCMGEVDEVRLPQIYVLEFSLSVSGEAPMQH